MNTVRWKQSALDELALLWVAADSPMRQAITSASFQIDQVLQNKPEEFGESREEGVRIGFLFPLGFRFEVDHEHAIVRVLQVWGYRRKG